MEDLRRTLSAHIDSDEKMFTKISGFLEALREDYHKIKENHLAHIQSSMGRMEVEIGWLKWGMLAILGGIIATYFKR